MPKLHVHNPYSANYGSLLEIACLLEVVGLWLPQEEFLWLASWAVAPPSLAPLCLPCDLPVPDLGGWHVSNFHWAGLLT